MYIKLQVIKKATHNIRSCIWGEMSYFQAALNDYNQQEKKRLLTCSAHLINICGIKDAMNYIGVYKFPPFVKSGKSHFVSKNFSKEMYVFLIKLDQQIDGCNRRFIYPNQYTVIIIFTSCLRVGWSCIDKLALFSE